jgi:hypothetical protein
MYGLPGLVRDWPLHPLSRTDHLASNARLVPGGSLNIGLTVDGASAALVRARIRGANDIKAATARSRQLGGMVAAGL